jgi:dynein heavy chain 1
MSRPDPAAMVAMEVPAATPLALISVDARYRVEHLIRDTGARSSVAMGSQEGFVLADQAIATASQRGTWVLLKNVHLTPSLARPTREKIEILNPNRLFLTIEANPSIPVIIFALS